MDEMRDEDGQTPAKRDSAGNDIPGLHGRVVGHRSPELERLAAVTVLWRTRECPALRVRRFSRAAPVSATDEKRSSAPRASNGAGRCVGAVSNVSAGAEPSSC